MTGREAQRLEEVEGKVVEEKDETEEDNGFNKKAIYDIWFMQFLDWFCKICMPVIGSCFVISYWTLGIIN